MNSKLGPGIIPNDLHDQTPYGAVLAGILERHGLIVVNGSQMCICLITRKREDGVEESVIDDVSITEDLVKDLDSMQIDEERNHVLTRMTKTKKGAT